MADSNTTKRALATALKELMSEKSFDKISISDICDKCRMNRKSFYYHFKDKYDLVNWIFDTEFSEVAYGKDYTEPYVLLGDISEYFFTNREFYKKALYIKGQNSFSDHFRELMLLLITKTFEDLLQVEAVGKFQINFFADALVMAFQRWILEYSGMNPSEFLDEIKLCIKYLAAGYEEEKQ